MFCIEVDYVEKKVSISRNLLSGFILCNIAIAINLEIQLQLRILYYITFSRSQNIYNNKGNMHETLNSPHLFVCLGSFSFISLALPL